MKRVVSYYLITLGLFSLIFSAYLYWERTTPQRLAFDTDYHNTPGKPIKTKQPLEVILQKEHIDLPIYPAEVKKNTWDTTTKGISYLISSPVPGEKGNSILYGHNWTSLFGNLVSVKPGEKVTVRYTDKTRKIFTVTSTMIVTPDKTTILAPSSDSRITLYTCTGFLDSKRFVAVALLDN